jgi:hypothetical protein
VRVGEDGQALEYVGRRRGGGEPDSEAAERDPMDFLVRVLMDAPEPLRHVIRYYGVYSSVVRARRARQEVAAGSVGSAAASVPAEREPPDRDP